MKKILVLLSFIFLFIESFSEKNDDYHLFLNGKKYYYNKDYEKARQNFEALLKTFSKSNVFSTNYAYFYIGMNYYKLNDYKNAAYYLEKAVYSSDIFLNNNYTAENIHFFAERDFALGDSLIKIGDKKKGDIYLKRVNYDTYYPFSAYYEREALKLLGEENEEFKNLLNLKFYYDFSLIDNFSTDKLLNIGHFYHSKKVYDREKDFYEKILKRKKLNIEEREEITKNYLEALLANNNKEEILEFTSNLPFPELKNLYSYYRGLAFYQLKDFSRALYLLTNVQSGAYYSKANYYVAGIYFALGEYQETLNALIKVDEKNILTDNMAAFSYYYLNDEINVKKAIESIIKKYPNEYAGMYFNYLNNTTEKVYVNSLENLLKFSDFILNNMASLPKDFLQKGDILEIDQFSQIAKLGDRQLLRILLKKSVFFQKESPETTFAITTILENGKFYELAFKNSNNHMGDFSKYTELFKYNFPLYYQEVVDKYSKKYDVPQELIYTIIHNISEFNSYYISKDSKFGLMNLPYSENSSFEFFELFDIDRNIEEGVKILKNYLDKFEGNKIKTLIAYVYGEDYLKDLYFGYDNDINLSSIIIPEERFFLQNLFMTYIFYLRLYNFD